MKKELRDVAVLGVGHTKFGRHPDKSLMDLLQDSIKKVFCDGQDIYSQIDIFGRKINKNMLRWAVMPYLYALSLIKQ